MSIGVGVDKVHAGRHKQGWNRIQYQETNLDKTSAKFFDSTAY